MLSAMDPSSDLCREITLEADSIFRHEEIKSPGCKVLPQVLGLKLAKTDALAEPAVVGQSLQSLYPHSVWVSGLERLESPRRHTQCC